MFELVEKSSAVISDCGLYRYELFRRCAPQGICFAFFGVNPSKAAAIVEDQTTMKWRGFTLCNGGGSYYAGNPFAGRATNVSDLANMDDPIGPENDYYIGRIIERADVLVPCWGNRTKVEKHLRRQFDLLLDRLFESGKPVKTFGFTKSGDPKHPLMLSYNTLLIDYPRRGVAA